jgi:hypothetical protein
MMRINITILPILRFLIPCTIVGVCSSISWIILVPPGPYPQVDPSLMASDTVTRRETQTVPSYDTLIDVVVHRIYQWK